MHNLDLGNNELTVRPLAECKPKQFHYSPTRSGDDEKLDLVMQSKKKTLTPTHSF